MYALHCIAVNSLGLFCLWQCLLMTLLMLYIEEAQMFAVCCLLGDFKRAFCNLLRVIVIVMLLIKICMHGCD